MALARIRRTLLAALAMTTLAACGGGEATEGAEDPGPVVRGGTLTVAVDSDPRTLNPVLRTTALAGSIYGILNDGLIEMNTDLDFEPSLATRWFFSDDGLTLTYHLRDDVRWSDGEPFTSRDVLVTYELFTNPDVPTPRRSNFDDIAGVAAPNDTTVVFSFHRRTQESLLRSAFPLMPAHAIESRDPIEIESWDLNRAPITNGPYRLAEWQSDDRIVLERNPHYADEPAYLDRIVFRVVPEEATRLLQLEIGEVDMIESVPNKDLERLRDDPEVQLKLVGPRFLGYLLYNLENELLADARVRNAISFAIDRRAFVEGLLFGYGRTIANPMTPIVAWAYNDELEPHTRDLERSRRLLASAGFEDTDGDGIVERDGVPLRFTVKTRTGDPVRENGALILRNNLREVGIDAETRMLELSTVLAQVSSGDFDAYMGQVAAPISPDLSASFASDGGFNWGGYANPAVDALIERARGTVDRDEAAVLWKQVQELLYRDQPMTMLYAKDPPVGLRVEVRNATPNFLSPYEDVHRWWKTPGTED